MLFHLLLVDHLPIVLKAVGTGAKELAPVAVAPGFANWSRSFGPSGQSTWTSPPRPALALAMSSSKRTRPAGSRFSAGAIAFGLSGFLFFSDPGHPTVELVFFVHGCMTNHGELPADIVMPLLGKGS